MYRVFILENGKEYSRDFLWKWRADRHLRMMKSIGYRVRIAKGKVKYGPIKL